MANAAGTNAASASRLRTAAPAHNAAEPNANPTDVEARIASIHGMAPILARTAASTAKAIGENSAVNRTRFSVQSDEACSTSLGVYGGR
jgi:hypothetical protein